MDCSAQQWFQHTCVMRRTQSLLIPRNWKPEGVSCILRMQSQSIDEGLEAPRRVTGKLKGCKNLGASRSDSSNGRCTSSGRMDLPASFLFLPLSCPASQLIGWDWCIQGRSFPVGDSPTCQSPSLTLLIV